MIKYTVNKNATLKKGLLCQETFSSVIFTLQKDVLVVVIGENKFMTLRDLKVKLDGGEEHIIEMGNSFFLITGEGQKEINEKIDFIDEFLAKCEDWMHGQDGQDVTRCRKNLDELKMEFGKLGHLRHTHKLKTDGDMMTIEQVIQRRNENLDVKYVMRLLPLSEIKRTKNWNGKWYGTFEEWFYENASPKK